ncbi:alpha/beta hydrolase [Streptomyces celluloflavus]|uniref:alpha/beta hydrolase n=1 Tax=Streptomyces celluloflavus TaxID=58344 RepID=UPI003460BBC8|nr:hypothetical protein OG717_37490 [Streptomyces celluloflavus]
MNPRQSRTARLRALSAAVLLLTVVCVTGAAPARVTPPLNGCVPDSARVVPVTVPEANETLPVAVLGHGRRMVVLSNQSDENLCSWLPFATTLIARGYAVALWDFGDASPVTELDHVVRTLRTATGVPRPFLAGASWGAKVSLIVAAQARPQVRGVVTLSAERILHPSTDVLDYVRKVRSPLLLVTADHDPYGSAEAAALFLEAAPTHHKTLISIPGTRHGTALLTAPAPTAVVPRILAFLRASEAGE